MITVSIRKLSLVLICAMAFSTQTANADDSVTLQYEQSESKSAFINRLSLIIQKENEKILQERRFVEDFFKRYEGNQNNLDSSSFNSLLDIAKRYKISDILDKNEYLEKIDEIPLSLALSQAILESGWGKSTVAKRSQNYFGQRKFTSKTDRDNVRYANFNTLEESARAYMQNLNSHDAYKEFRTKRLACTQNHQTFNGKAALKTLTNYSTNGKYYMQMLSQIISKHLASIDNTKAERSNLRAYL